LHAMHKCLGIFGPIFESWTTKLFVCIFPYTKDIK
jgi:hypothetical protein